MHVRFARTTGSLALATTLAPFLAGCGTTAHNGTFHPAAAPSQSGTGPDLSSSGEESSPTAAPPTVMSSPTFTKTILDDYRAYQTAYQQAYESDDPSGLSAVAAGPLLSSVVKDIQQTKAKNLVYRFAVQLNPRVQFWETNQSLAVVVDCMRTLAWYSFSETTGKPVSSSTNSSTKLYRYAMTYDPISRAWKASAVKGESKC